MEDMFAPKLPSFDGADEQRDDDLFEPSPVVESTIVEDMFAPVTSTVDEEETEDGEATIQAPLYKAPDKSIYEKVQQQQEVTEEPEGLDPRVDALMNKDFDFAEENIDNIYATAVANWERERVLKDDRYYKVEVEDITNIQLGDDVRKPTREEVLRDYMIEREDRAFMVNEMIKSDNPIRSELATTLVDQGYSPLTITYIMEGAEWSPFLGAAMGIIDIPENVAAARQAYEDEEYGIMLANMGITAVELFATITSTKQLAAPVLKGLKNKTTGARTMAEIEKNSASVTAAKQAEAKKVADENSDIADQLIDEYEASISEATGKAVVVSKTVNGKKTLDFNAAKAHGLEVAEDVKAMQDIRAADFVTDRVTAERKYKVTEEKALTGLTDEADELVNPLLKPEKFNAIVAVASEFKKKNPKAFRKDETIIEGLFRLTTDVDSGFADSQELADVLSKYGLSFDDYVHMVVSGGSEAGKILNKLSQIRKAASLDDLTRAKEKVQADKQNKFVKGWRRIENIRRGGMVSMVKTAFRNAGSAAIRTPLETLENVFDNILLNMSDQFQKRGDIGVLKAGAKALGAGGKTLASWDSYAGSTRMLQRMYLNPVLSKEVTDFVLKRPEFMKQHTNMFDLVNEYQTATGRGQGGFIDKGLSKVEDAVTLLNTPNRIQEFTIRRAAFIGELERLVKRDYGKDLMELLKEGKIDDLIANSSKVRPKGAPAFEELIEDSTRRALDITYASPPEIPVFNNISNFLTRNGLTAVTTPFPRFMFKSLELMGQYGGGALNPMIKRAFNIDGKKFGDKFDRKDRQNISRNLTGGLGILAAVQYRNSDDAPSDYKEIQTEEGTVWDATSFFPMRQALWIAEGARRLSEGTFGSWFDVKDVQETFLGTAARTGVANIYVEEIRNIIASEKDLVSSESAKKLVSRGVADYLRTWAIPLTQIPELQRATGYRPAWYADQADDRATLTESYIGASLEETSRSFRQAGLTNVFTPSEEFEREERVDIFQPDKERKSMGLGLVAGITQYSMDNPSGEYLKDKGFNDWEMGSKSRIPSRKRIENAYMQEAVPALVDMSKSYETALRKEYLNSTDPDMRAVRKSESIDKFVNKRIVPYLKAQKNKFLDLAKEVSGARTDPLLLAHEKFRKLDKDTRKLAMSEWMRQNGEPPEMSDASEVEALIELGRIYKGVLSK